MMIKRQTFPGIKPLEYKKMDKVWDEFEEFMR